MRSVVAAACLALPLSALVPLPAAAFEVVSDRDTFLSLVEGRELRIGLLGIALTVQADGTIGGTAQGRPVTGAWTWENGLFCRDMAWGEEPIPYNCQLVEIEGAAIRFTVDAGAGQAAVFNLS